MEHLENLEMIAAILKLPKSLPTGIFKSGPSEQQLALANIFEASNPWNYPHVYLDDTLRKLKNEKRKRR